MNTNARGLLTSPTVLQTSTRCAQTPTLPRSLTLDSVSPLIVYTILPQGEGQLPPATTSTPAAPSSSAVLATSTAARGTLCAATATAPSAGPGTTSGPGSDSNGGNRSSRWNECVWRPAGQKESMGLARLT